MIRRFTDLPPDSPIVSFALWYSRTLRIELMPRRPAPDGKLIDVLRGSPRSGLWGPHEVAAFWAAFPETKAFASVFGPRSRLFVLDVDTHDADGPAELAKLEERHGRLPPAPCVLTPTGRGSHLYFAWPARRIRTGAIAPGVEVLADRAAATLPPSVKQGKPYRWHLERHIDFLPPPPAPDWLLRLAAPRTLLPSRRPPQRATSNRYVEAAITSEIQALRAAPRGDRNRQLNRSAWSLARFVRDGAISADAIRDELAAAAAVIGLGRHETLATINSGLQRAAR